MPPQQGVADADAFKRLVEGWVVEVEKQGTAATLTVAALRSHAVAVLAHRGDVAHIISMLSVKTAAAVGLRKKAPPRPALYNPLLWATRHFHRPSSALEVLQAARARGTAISTDTWNMVLGAVCPAAKPDDITAVLSGMEGSNVRPNVDTLKHLASARTALLVEPRSGNRRAIADLQALLLRMLTTWDPVVREDTAAAEAKREKRERRRRARSNAAQAGAASPTAAECAPSDMLGLAGALNPEFLRPASTSRSGSAASGSRPKLSTTTKELVLGSSSHSITSSTGGGGQETAPASSQPPAAVSRPPHDASQRGGGGALGLGFGGVTINLDPSGMTAQELADALVTSLSSLQASSGAAPSSAHADHTPQPTPSTSAATPTSEGQYLSLAGLGGGLGLSSGGQGVWGSSLGLGGSPPSASSTGATDSQARDPWSLAPVDPANPMGFPSRQTPEAEAYAQKPPPGLGGGSPAPQEASTWSQGGQSTTPTPGSDPAMDQAVLQRAQDLLGALLAAQAGGAAPGQSAVQATQAAWATPGAPPPHPQMVLEELRQVLGASAAPQAGGHMRTPPQRRSSGTSHTSGGGSTTHGTPGWDGTSDVSRASRGSGGRSRGNRSTVSGTSRASGQGSNVSGRSGSTRGSGHNSPRKLSRKQIGLLPTPPAAPHMMPGGTNPMLTPAGARRGVVATSGATRPPYPAPSSSHMQGGRGGVMGVNPPPAMDVPPAVAYASGPPSRSSMYSMHTSRSLRSGSVGTSFTHGSRGISIGSHSHGAMGGYLPAHGSAQGHTGGGYGSAGGFTPHHQHQHHPGSQY